MDTQLSNPAVKNEFIFVTSEQTKRSLKFRFSRVKWNPKNESNIPLKTKRCTASQFSREWDELGFQGWRVCG